MSLFTYVDTSGLAKRFWREPGTDIVLRAFEDAKAIATVSLSYVELISATFRAARRGDVPSADVPRVLEAIRDEWKDYVRLPVDDDIIQQAASLTQRHAIRAYDAVHLAAALKWQAELGETIGFLVFDQELAKAGAAEGLTTIPG
jgi:predicted nucleic acid-binding protein